MINFMPIVHLSLNFWYLLHWPLLLIAWGTLGHNCSCLFILKSEVFRSKRKCAIGLNIFDSNFFLRMLIWGAITIINLSLNFLRNWLRLEIGFLVWLSSLMKLMNPFVELSCSSEWGMNSNWLGFVRETGDKNIIWGEQFDRHNDLTSA